MSPLPARVRNEQVRDALAALGLDPDVVARVVLSDESPCVCVTTKDDLTTAHIPIGV